MPIQFTDDPNTLVNTNRTAFLAAMLFDQQVPITWAFAGPQRLADRLKVDFTPAAIAAIDLDTFRAAAAEKPAVHRYHRSMATRLHAMCSQICANWDGDTDQLLTTPDAAVVANRLAELPGFGDEKVKITIAALVKRFGYVYTGWESVAEPFGDDQPRSVADIGDADDLALVKEWKKAQRDAGLSKQSPTAR